MMKLLVSVRTVAESITAAQCGVDVIDVKEPQRGALGAADVSVLRAIGRQQRGATCLSMACGELRDRPAFDERTLKPYQFAKVGLAGLARDHDWPKRWLDWAECLPDSVRPVLVLYADYRQSEAPAPDAVLHLAAGGRADALLVDTFCKDGRNSIDHLGAMDLSAIVQQVHGLGLPLALAGSLSAEMVPEIVRRYHPDYLAVRGAACRDSDRRSGLCATRIADLQQRMRRAVEDGKGAPAQEAAVSR